MVPTDGEPDKDNDVKHNIIKYAAELDREGAKVSG